MPGLHSARLTRNFMRRYRAASVFQQPSSLCSSSPSGHAIVLEQVGVTHWRPLTREVARRSADHHVLIPQAARDQISVISQRPDANRCRQFHAIDGINRAEISDNRNRPIALPEERSGGLRFRSRSVLNLPARVIMFHWTSEPMANARVIPHPDRASSKRFLRQVPDD